MKNINDYDERIVAFVDILGFKNLVDESVIDHYTYLRIHDALEDFRKLKKDKEDEAYDKDVKVTTFSDSLVISYPINYSGGMFDILLDLRQLQFLLLQRGIFVRGGIATGKMRHVWNEVFGPAMNEAYFLENKKAIYPRIIVSLDTANKGIDSTYDKYVAPDMEQYSWMCESEDVYGLLKKDSDNWYSLDYLRMSDEMDTFDDYLLYLSKVRSFIQKAIDTNRDNEDVLKKYIWVAEYFNTVLSEVEVNKKTNIKLIEVSRWLND